MPKIRKFVSFKPLRPCMIYTRWKGMKDRTRYVKTYVEKGISICPEWHDYYKFRAWALANGFRPELTLDRIDNDGDYTPDNCQWITKSENSRKDRKIPTHDKPVWRRLTDKEVRFAVRMVLHFNFLRAVAAETVGMSEDYLTQIINGQRRPIATEGLI